MKILLLSDTHRNLDKVYQVWEKLNQIDLILHCGDYQHDAYQLEDNLGVPVISVKGNCDGETEGDRQIVETPAGNLLLTHGHLEGVKYDVNALLYLAEESGCIAACFGHTHVPFCQEFNGIWLINPGSISRPRDGSHGSYGILRCEPNDFYANIVYYDRIFPAATEKESVPSGSAKKTSSQKKSRVRGGFLRNLLNHSDRL